MAHRYLTACLLLVLAGLLGMALYSPDPYGAWGVYAPALLIALFGPLAMLLPLVLGYLGAFCFLPLARETCIGLCWLSWSYYLLGVTWLASGLIGEATDQLLDMLFGASRYVVLAGTYIVITMTLFGPRSILRVLRTSGRFFRLPKFGLRRAA